MFAQARDERRGFSLLEVTATLALIALIFGLAMPAYLGYLTKRRLQNAAFLVLNDLRLAQQAAVAQSGEGPRVEICFRDDGYDIYKVIFASLGARTGALRGAIVKSVHAGSEYPSQVTMRVVPEAKGETCLLAVNRAALGFVGSGAPYPDDGERRSAELSTGGQTALVDLEPGTGLARIH